MKSVVDKNGVEIEQGQAVLVHQDDGTREAVVVATYPDSPTVNDSGHWVDIDGGQGPEGMMSYLIEVKQLVAALFLALLFAIPCSAQDGLVKPYVRYGMRYETSPPRLYSAGRYMGELSTSRYRADSISNPYGVYGSRYSSSSLNNPYRRYATQPIYVAPMWRVR